MRPLREREIEPGVGAADVEPVRGGEDRRIPIGGSDRHGDQVAAPGCLAEVSFASALQAGSLALELRAWTESYDDWLQIRSDLIGTINQRLAHENIALA